MKTPTPSRNPVIDTLSLWIVLAASGCTPMPPSAGHDAGGPGGPAAVETAGKAPVEAAGKAPVEATGKAAVVVELFTSEGCSSCPPADDLLRQLSKGARTAGKPVFFLSFHVDYWNQLGWPDPFSSRVYTDRQNAYAQAAGTSRVYTPQMIIGGRNEFVGSSEDRARKGVADALDASSRAAVSLKAKAASGGSVIDMTYAVTGAPPGAVLNLALVEDGLVVRVPRGENAGRTLAHDGVVRLFKTISLDRGAEGALSITWPAEVNRSKASFIAYAQEASTFEILGASSAPAPP